MELCSLSGPIDCLAKLEHLSVIDLGLNSLSSPVPETFANFKNLTTLSLYSCNLRGIFPKKIFQLGTLSFIDISSNDLHGSLPDFPLNASLNTLLVSDTNFSGTLPNSIGNLRQLSELDLSSCQFNGTLPSSLSNLTQLVHLDLSDNGFTGPIPSLSKCKRLATILLHQNYFNGSLSSTHFESLLNLTQIWLYNNSITGKLPVSIFGLPSMQDIQLSNNQFDGKLDGFINFSSGIQGIDLSSNYLEGPIPPSLFQLEELADLNLSFNNFSGKIELDMIQKLVSLRTLDLSYNSLTVIDAKTTFPFPPAFTSLRLASCKLTKFPELLKNLSRLDDLDLSNNHLAGKIPHWIVNLNYLQQLNLSYNYLVDWEKPLLNNLSNLVALDVHSNYLRGQLPVLPLQYIDYSMNNLSSMIPPHIGNYLSSTQFLSFSSNNLYGNIPKSICNASFLQVLDLSNNYLTGTIPKCLIAMNGSLAILNLGRNKLTGTIGTFAGLCALRTLDLNGNFLQGKLPRYLVNCTMLEVLDLGYNQIDDQFPCWLKSISTLHVLVLRTNKLHGSLKCPKTKLAWSNLQIIDLASNNFSGKIPPTFFETCKAMMVVENDENMLKLNPLQFQGPYVDNIYYRDKVTVTYKNAIVEIVKIQITFTFVDFSCNKFEGPIPKELMELKALHILNLSHNAFSGHIPSSIGTLK